jgi:hypothetical protein
MSDKRLVTLLIEDGEWGNYWVSRVEPDGLIGEPADLHIGDDLKALLGPTEGKS